MSAYAGNAKTMTEHELMESLKCLAANWRAAPHLSNDYSEGARYEELKEELKERFGVSVIIEKDSHSTDYHVTNA